MDTGQVYLGLRARISQAWLAPPLIVLVVFIVKLALLKSVIFKALETAARLVEMECQDLKAAVTQAAQIPQESVQLATRLVNSALNHEVQSVMRGLSISLTAIEELIYLALEMTVGTYACFTISAVNIGANEAINATEFIVKEVNKTTEDIGHELNAGLGKLSSFINGAIGLIDSVEDFINGGDSYLHAVNLTSSKLDHLNISSNINFELESLRKDIPTYEGTTKAVKSLISKPFSLLQTQIRNNNITVNLQFKPQNSSSTWASSSSPYGNRTLAMCSAPHVGKAFEEVKGIVLRLTVVFCVLCGLTIIIGVAWNVWKANSQWMRLVTAASSSSSSNTRSPIYGNKEPEIGNNISTESRRFRVDSATRTNLNRITTQLEFGWVERHLQPLIPQQYWWTLHYCLTTPLVSFLKLGLCGLAISILELAVIKSFKDGTRFLKTLEKQIANNMTGDAKLLYSQWSNQTNSEISAIEKEVNTRLLGWVHNGTRSLNNTIETFVESVNTEIYSVFNGTMLLKPLQAVANCLFENKAKSIEQGLTWAYKNTQISLPNVSDAIFNDRSNSSSITSSKPFRQASLVVANSIASLEHEIKVQFLCSGVFIALWVGFAILAYSINRNLSLVNTQFTSSSPEASSSTFGIRRDKRPAPLNSNVMPISSPVKVTSPFEQISNRVTQFFSGPAHRVSMREAGAPRHGSILKAETPRTPLRAMIINA